MGKARRVFDLSSASLCTRLHCMFAVEGGIQKREKTNLDSASPGAYWRKLFPAAN